tara:strand:+ start:650 stop:1012 length:363 start_codon:yes stop_codon:yes gene_type:complete
MSLIDQLRKKVKSMEHVTTGTLMAEAENLNHTVSVSGSQASQEAAIAVTQVYQEVLASKSVAKVAETVTEEDLGLTHTKASLNKMSKTALEALGRSSFNIELDRRKTKSHLIERILRAQN